MSSKTSIPSAKNRVLSLDGIRGFFTLAVIFAHSIYFGGLGDVFWHHRPIAGFSRFDQATAAFLWPLRDAVLPGMDVFFVLSSFLITGNLCDAEGSNGYFSRFYLRRTLRIFPLYYLALAVLLAVTRLTDPTDPFLNRQIWYWTYLSNALLARGWDQAPAQFHHFWSLAVEEQFYVVWPAVVFFLGRRRLKAAAILMIIGSLAFRIGMYALDQGSAVYVATPGRLDQLAIGALIALKAREPGSLAAWGETSKPVLSGSLALILAMGFWRGGLSEPDAVNGTIGHTLYAVFAGALLCRAMVASSGLQRFFSARFFRVCGKYSYALYVFHQPILLGLTSAWGLTMWRLPPFPGFVLVGQIAIGTLAFSAVFALALLSWRLVEKPCLQLRSRMENQKSEILP